MGATTVEIMSETAVVHCTVLELRPARQGRVLALATVQIEIEGIVLTIEGVQVHRFRFPGDPRDMIGVRPPQYRAADGCWRDAIHMPREVEEALGDVVLAECREAGLQVHGVGRDV